MLRNRRPRLRESRQRDKEPNKTLILIIRTKLYKILILNIVLEFLSVSRISLYISLIDIKDLDILVLRRSLSLYNRRYKEFSIRMSNI